MSDDKNYFSSFQKSIDVRQLAYESIRRWYIIVIMVTLSIVFSFAYTKLFMTPMYSSTARILVIKKVTITDATTANDLELSASSYLTRNFTEIINDEYVLTDVAEALDNKYSNSQIKGFLSINNPQSTHVIDITATTPNANDSQKIVSTICDVAQEKIVELMGLDRIQPFNYGKVPLAPSSPNLSRNILTGALFGLLISLSTVVILYITDNKVSSIDDVEKYLGLSVLATIPYNNKGKTSKRKSAYSK